MLEHFAGFFTVWIFYNPFVGAAIFIALACGVYFALDKAEALV